METKEKIAPYPFVGANGGRSSQTTDYNISDSTENYNSDSETDEDIDEMYRKLQRATNPDYLHTVSMPQLYEMTYRSRPPIIEGLLYPGVYILAGAPKIGKSFLVAQMAFHVSTGESLWSREVRRGTVLYLALEDTFERLQSRMFTMYGVNDTEHLHFATTAGKLDGNLEAQMKNFIAENRDTELIIIDTLQMIREADGEAYNYGRDYKSMEKLKVFAEQNRVCILLVHHTRKQQADDSFDMISGTNGLLGSADGAFLMRKEKRTSLEARLEVVGRDQQEQVLYLKKDPLTQIWNLEKTETDFYREPSDPVLEAVAKLVSPEHREWTGTPTELAKEASVGLAANAVSKYLNVRCGKLLEDYHVKYENRMRHLGREVTLTYVPEKEENMR